MAHEIYANDHLVLAGEPAWHGLGTVVEDAPTPREALRLARMEWKVEEAPLSATLPDGSVQPFATHKALVRSDDRTVLNVVGIDYHPIQNEFLAELAEGLRGGADLVGGAPKVLVESAGTLKGGLLQWFLLRGNTIEIGRRGDMSTTYMAIFNGHDGRQPLTIKPVNVRVVCHNTWRAALGEPQAHWSIRHTKMAGVKAERLVEDINRWTAFTARGAEKANAMAAVTLGSQAARTLFSEILLEIDGPTPTNPENKFQENRRNRHLDALATMQATFDLEAPLFGPTLWVAVNAATKWIQTERLDRMKETEDMGTAREYSKWNGTADECTAAAFKVALRMLP